MSEAVSKELGGVDLAELVISEKPDLISMQEATLAILRRLIKFDSYTSQQLAGDLRKVMPKPNSKKKESVSANLQEDDLPSNFEESEIENDTLILLSLIHI